MGARIGYTSRQVQQVESGATAFSIPMLYCIARALNAPVGYFFTGLDKTLNLPPVRRGIRPDFEELLTAYFAIPDGMHQRLHDLLTGLMERGHSLP